MISTKPYVKKPISWSPRDLQVLANIRGYVIRTFSNDGENVIVREARVQCPGQCIAALRVAYDNNLRLLVYAIGESYEEQCLALVDEGFLLGKMK
jgi:hypothetical protein